jgi:PhzF family phenazine biosynthesis protein
MPRRLLEMDVFGLAPLLGNPLAVVLDGEGLDCDTMQRFAAWTNFSETTFVLPPSVPDADYQVRIFTPRTELPFAGHPSIGTAFAVLDQGLIPAGRGLLRMQCKAGVLPLRVTADAQNARLIMVRAPAPCVSQLGPSAAANVCAALGLPTQQTVWSVDVGARWIVLDADTQAQVLQIRPDFRALANLTGAQAEVGVTIFGRCERSEFDAFEVRSFAPADGINEDPVCGSGNAAVAAVLLQTRQLQAGQSYSVRQGRACQRDGRVHVAVDASGHIEIGGSARCLVSGSLQL